MALRLNALWLARVNHLLIPATKDGRDRIRRSRWGNLLSFLWVLYESLTPLGQLLFLASVLSVGMSLDVFETSTHLLWAALSALWLVSLVLGRRAAALRLTGVSLVVRAPRRVAVGEELVFTLHLRNEGARDHLCLRAFGPFLPWDGRWSGRPEGLGRLAVGEAAQLTCRARFAVRGEHHLDPFRVAALVPLGISLGPSVHSEGVRFVVVPRPARVLRCPPPRGERHQPGGVALAARTGEALDLLGLRPYRPGDLVRDLHARSWARAGVPIVREHQQEFFTRVALVLDTDPAGGGDREERLEAALALTAGLCARLLADEVIVDLYIGTPRPVEAGAAGAVTDGPVLRYHGRQGAAAEADAPPLTLGRGLAGAEQALELLAEVAPGPRFAAERVLFRLQPALPRLAGLIFVSLAWDAGRAGLLQAAHRSGLGARALWVVDEAGGDRREEAVQQVGCAAIRAASQPGGAGLSL